MTRPSWPDQAACVAVYLVWSGQVAIRTHGRAA
jgi:hypothetical protein